MKLNKFCYLKCEFIFKNSLDLQVKTKSISFIWRTSPCKSSKQRKELKEYPIVSIG